MLEVPRARFAGELGACSLVHGVDVGAERAVELLGLVPEQRDRPARRERVRGALVAVGAVDPVPRLRGVDQREVAGADVQVLERIVSTSTPLRAQHRRHLRASVRAVHNADRDATNASRRLAGARADLERAVTASQPAELDDRVEQRVGIPRPGAS